MKLFDKIQNSGSETASYTEPNFVYLIRSSREEFARMRDLLEVWFEVSAREFVQKCPIDEPAVRNYFPALFSHKN
jgi:hypothetical protein